MVATMAVATGVVVISEGGNGCAIQCESKPVATSLQRSQTTVPNHSSDISSIHFQVLAALELKEELEKVRLAQLIHDLHELAKKHQEQRESGEDGGGVNPAPRGLRKYVTMLKRTVTKSIQVRRNKTGMVKNAAEGDDAEAGTELQRSKSVSSPYLPLQATEHDAIDPTMWCLNNFSNPESSPKQLEPVFDGLLNVDDKRTMHPTSLTTLVNAATHVLEEEPTVIDLRDNHKVVTVVGDLHGSLESLARCLKLIGPVGPVADELARKGRGEGGETDGDGKRMRKDLKPERIIVFDGDFVDRGHESLEVLCTLLLLKLLYPKHVYLLRGNHEDEFIASVYGFRDELRSKYPTEFVDEFWQELTDLFAMLPLAARTDDAIILHGGIPDGYVDIDRDMAAITVEDRTKLRTFTSVADEDERKFTTREALVRDVLWSDPHKGLKYKNSIKPNPRGCGVIFGPKVARVFLDRNDVKYMVRAHEASERGYKVLDCGDGKAVLTVFSAAAYPGGEGTNSGAILHLHPDGSYTTDTFHLNLSKARTTVRVRKKERSIDKGLDTIRNLIARNQIRLRSAFEQCQDRSGYITTDQWASVLGEQLELKDMPWKMLKSSLVPSDDSGSDNGEASLSEEGGGDHTTDGVVDWKKFLDSHAHRALNQPHQESLAANHHMLLTVFKFLDVDGDGSVNRQEFRTGVQVLNKNLPKGRQLGDPDLLFDVLDTDGDGNICLKEFEHIFQLI